MTWKPESGEWHQRVDLTSTITSSVNTSNNSSISRLGQQFRSSSGATYGELEFPESAPLVFPALDELKHETGQEAVRKRDKLKQAAGFLQNYWDRRAQAEYVSLFSFAPPALLQASFV
jgi:hypothetical protein